jgi:hypothetical protein
MMTTCKNITVKHHSAKFLGRLTRSRQEECSLIFFLPRVQSTRFFIRFSNNNMSMFITPIFKPNALDGAFILKDYSLFHDDLYI